MFGKKRTLDEILKDIANLSDEDKAKIKDKMEDLYKAEDEREVDKIEEDKAENTETESENEEAAAEEPDEETEEVEEELQEDKTDKLGEILDRLSKIEAAIEGFNRKPKEADSETADKLSALDRKFN